MKNKIKRLFQNADDDTLNTLSERYPAAGSKEREKIYRKIAKGSSIPSESFETDNAYEVRGVDIYMKSKWKKPAIAAVTCLLIVGGVIGGSIFTAKKLNNKSTLSAQPIINEDGRSVITIGVPVKNAYLQQIIENYNNYQEKYYVQFIDYTDKTGNKKMPSNYEWDDEKELMKLDITSGDAPDIICDDNRFISEIIHLDMVEDLYELMDKYGGISPDDILPNIRDGLDINGKMPAITDGFYITTCAALNEYVGEKAENWTTRQFTEVCHEQLPNFESLINTRTDSLRSQVFDVGTERMSCSCVNLEIMNCDFSGYGLKEITELANSFPDREIDGGSPGNSLLCQFTITGLDRNAGQSLLGNFKGESFIFTGYPSNNGKGSIIGCGKMLSISKNCVDKEGAWDFINYYLINGNELKDKYMIAPSSIMKKYLYAQYNNKNKKDENSIYSAQYGEEYISQEYVDKIYDFILNVKFEPYLSSEVSNIVSEELEYVYNGERTPDQCIDILNDRIGTYLAENK